MKQRAISWILILVLVFSISGLPAAFADGETGEQNISGQDGETASKQEGEAAEQSQGGSFTVTVEGEAQNIAISNDHEDWQYDEEAGEVVNVGADDKGFEVKIDGQDAVELAKDPANNVTAEGDPASDSVSFSMTGDVIYEPASSGASGGPAADSDAVDIRAENGGTVDAALQNVSETSKDSSPGVNSVDIYARESEINLTAKDVSTATSNSGSSYGTALNAQAYEGSKITAILENASADVEGHSGWNSAGGIVGSSYGESSVQIEAQNVDVKMTAPDSYSNNAAGVYGVANGKGSNTEIQVGDVTVQYTAGQEEETPDDPYDDPDEQEYEPYSGYSYKQDGFYYSVSGVTAQTSPTGSGRGPSPTDQAKEEDYGKASVTAGNVTVTVEGEHVYSVAGAVGDGMGSDVKVQDVTVNAEYGSGIAASRGAEVTAENVTSGSNAVEVKTGGKATVNGNAESTGSSAIRVTLNSGDDAQSTVIVKGTAQGNGSAIWLDLYDFAKDDDSRIEAFRDASQASEKAFQEAKAEGKSGEEAYKASKAAYDESYRQYVNSEESVNAIINALPEIIVQTIPQEEGVDMVLVTSSDLSKENKAKVTEELLAQINYIVNTEGLDTANVAVYGAEVWEGGLMAKETVKLTVMALNGGSLAAFTAGDYATVEANNDGTYTVTVNRGGDLRLKANFIAKPGETADQGATNNPWLYVDGNCLVADLTKMVSGSILMSTLNRFIKNYDIDTFKILTVNGSFSIAIDELLGLLEGADCLTLVKRNESLDVCANWKTVTTLALSKAG